MDTSGIRATIHSLEDAQQLLACARLVGVEIPEISDLVHENLDLSGFYVCEECQTVYEQDQDLDDALTVCFPCWREQKGL